MEERTYIIGVSDLIDKVGKCKCYDDARNLLNSFVIENVGKQYEIEDGTKYRNSNNSEDIKREFLCQIDNYNNEWERMDEVGSKAVEYVKQYIKVYGGVKVDDKVTIKLLDDTTITDVFRKMCNIKINANGYIERWRKEPAPKIMKKEYRLRPKSNSVIQNIYNIFNYYVSTGNLDNESKERWDYLCGVNDSTKTKKPINWHGEWTPLCAIIEYFLLNKTYFAFDRGVTKYFLCDNMFINDDGTILNENNLANLKKQSKNNGSLDREKGNLQKVLEQTLST